MGMRERLSRSLGAAVVLSVFAAALLGGGVAASNMSWTPYPLPPVGNIIGQFNEVIFDGTEFWAVGANGWVQKSPDGVTWTSVAPGPTYFFYDIAHGGGNQYVVVGAGSGGAGSTVYVTNDGGLTWSQSTTGVPGFFSLYNVAHGASAGEYVAVGAGGTIVRSTDGGVTWSPPASFPQNFSPPDYRDLNSVIYAPIGTGLYVAVGGGGAILTSNDGGNTWTPRNSGTTVVLENVAYANGLFVAVGWNGTILTSTNGTTWTQVTPPPTTKNLLAVTYGPCGWVATGVQGTVLSSPNGTAWSAETSNTTAALLGVAYGAGRYVAGGQGTTLVGQCNQPADAPDLAIVKRAANTPWPVGGTGAFSISVSNAGNAALPAGTVVTVTESLPAGLTLTGATGTGWGCSPTSGAGPLSVTCTYTVPAGGLAAGASLPPLNFTVQVDKPGPYTNCAGVSGTLQGAVLQEPTGNNKSCVDIPTGSPSGGGKCAPLPTGAVAWWPLNETAGATTVADLVGGHTGTPLSGPVGSGGPNPTTGVVGGALYFTSQSTYVRVPDSPALNFGTGDFTVDAWINPVQVGSQWYQPIVDKTQATSSKGGAVGYRLYVKNGLLIFVLADGNTSALVAAPVTYGTWQFVAAERAGTNLNLYINGALAATAPLPAGFGSVSNAADLLVGGITGVGTPVQPIVGEIGLDEVELFNRALTQQEVQAIHQAGSVGKCAGIPPAEPATDLGDAPDRTNHPNKPMTAYPSVPANFPTVFDPATGTPPGPKHLQPTAVAWLGPKVTLESEADLFPPDQDNQANLDPSADDADRDGADDGLAPPAALPACGQVQLKYTVTVPATFAGTQKMYVNVWLDYNRDGDWEDSLKCPVDPTTTGLANEWAVQNQVITVGPGPSTLALITPAFMAANPAPGKDLWVRITLSEQPAPASAAGANPDGRGPSSGYKFGETEDYLWKQVGLPEEKPGRLCGVKFLDHDGDGQQDPGEPGLPNWTIQVKDAAGNVVKAVTGKKGRFCLEVKPGTYTVSEVLPPGWVQTAPQPVPPGTATVTVAAGQTVFVKFGNRPEKKPCCLTFTLQGGKPDQFSTADGATAEPATPPPGKPQTYFDQTAVNQAFWHRFTLPPGNCVREAKIELFVKPLGGQDYNDRIYLYSGSGSWVANLGSNSGNSGGANLLSNQWTVTNYAGGQLFTLGLASLPLPGGGTMSLLAALDQNRVLDLAVQDDTSVDFARLTVRFCECAQGEPEAVAAEAKGGASEISMVIGKPQITADGMDREIDTAPVVRGGRTFLPVRALAEALGLDVAWDPAERKVTLTIEDPPTAIELWVGRPEAKLTKADAARGIEKKDIRRVAIDPANPDVAPFIENWRVMLPVRFIAEALGLDVGFDSPTQQITIKRKSPPGGW